jgi:hypothetical protein
MPLLKAISLVALFLIACENVEYWTVRRRGKEVYPPKLGWRLTRWVVLGLTLITIGGRLDGNRRQPNDTPLWAAFSFSVLGAMWPRTVCLENEGDSSCSTFGFRRRFVPCAEVYRVDSDWEELRAHGFRLLGTCIHVLSQRGTRITHGVAQKSQVEFLVSWRRYLARDFFAPGSHDWDPCAKSKLDWSLRGSRRV